MSEEEQEAERKKQHYLRVSRVFKERLDEGYNGGAGHSPFACAQAQRLWDFGFGHASGFHFFWKYAMDFEINYEEFQEEHPGTEENDSLICVDRALPPAVIACLLGVHIAPSYEESDEEEAHYESRNAERDRFWQNSPLSGPFQVASPTDIDDQFYWIVLTSKDDPDAVPCDLIEALMVLAQQPTLLDGREGIGFPNNAYLLSPSDTVLVLKKGYDEGEIVIGLMLREMLEDIPPLFRKKRAKECTL